MLNKRKVTKSVITTLPVLGLTEYITATALEYLPKLQFDLKSLSRLKESFQHEWLLDPLNVLSTSFANEHFLTAQLLLIPGFIGLTAKEIFGKNKHKVEEADKYGAYGAARFLKSKELSAYKQDLSNTLSTPGTIVGMLDKKPVIHRETSYKNRNVAVFGISGTQKSKSYIIPNILNTESDSIIVTDPKGELFQKTSEAKRKQGYKVHLISFLLNESDKSDRYNPLDYVNRDSDASELAFSLTVNATGNPSGDNLFWAQAQSELIAALILYTKYFLPKEQQNLGSVYNLLTTNPDKLELLFKDIPSNHVVKRAFNGAISGIEEKMKGQFFSGAKVALALWKYDEVRTLTCKSDFNLQDIGKEKTIVYVRIPLTERNTRSLISTFFNQLFQQLYTLGDYEGGELPVPVRMLLDEFANIGTIPLFEEKLSTTRSYKIYVSIVLQGLEQLRDRYGKGKAAEIMDNCDTQIFLGTNDEEAKKYFSDKLGKTTARIRNESENIADRGSSEGLSYTYISKSLFDTYDIGQLPDDTSLVFMRGIPHMKLKKAFYTNIPSLYQLIEGKEIKLSNYEAPERERYNVFEPEEVINKILEEFALKKAAEEEKKVAAKETKAAVDIQEKVKEETQQKKPTFTL